MLKPKGVSWWILGQKRPTTPKVLIFCFFFWCKNSSHEELIQHQFFEKSTFLIFFEFYVFRKVILRRIQRKNYHLKVLPMSFWYFLDTFCTINEYTTTPRSKDTFCQSKLILLENSGFLNCGICVTIFKRNERTLTECIFWSRRRCIFVYVAKYI